MKQILSKEEALELVKNGNKAEYEKIFSFASEYAMNQFKVFSANDFKKAYLEAGNELPSQLNVFGSVFSNITKQELIYFFGYVKSNTPEAKGCIIRKWISREFKQRQANNASNKSNIKINFDENTV